ncbi:hypothetical protein UFOVP386_28 [uncultured Caudovirales phage]|uniref:Uncharacterized protein n=1 Tax=uncultured Caudovirales phage TaxID=2100421 RepID=A0A6J7X0Y9_9CAUD|nr:hypothetical protein UFOVP386_28 [uncultured Caudovirales phage]
MIEPNELARKIHKESFNEFKGYNRIKPELEKYYSNMIKKQINIILKNIEGIYQYESRSAEYMRNLQKEVTKL